VVHLVIAHPLDYVKSNIADVVGADNLFAAGFEDVADRAAQDYIPQVTYMQGFMRVGVGIFHHHWLALL